MEPKSPNPSTTEDTEGFTISDLRRGPDCHSEVAERSEAAEESLLLSTSVVVIGIPGSQAKPRNDNAWYIFPIQAVKAMKEDLWLFPHVYRTKSRSETYREAWHLLKN